MTHNVNREKAESILRLARITAPPVNLEKVAESLHFTILPFPFPDKRRGMVLIEEGNKTIGVNKNHPVTLQRFTIAHELGHYLNGHQHYEKQFINDDTRYYDPHYQQEKEADAFAAELLMPKEFLEKDLANLGLNIETLKEKYQVSEQSLWIRLTSLRLAEKYSKK